MPLVPSRALIAAALAALHPAAQSANPVGGKTPADYIPGMADPNIHFFDGQFLMFATHDFSVNNTGFKMTDWWVWSSPDAVTWTKESVVTPQASLKWDTQTSECWATDAAFVGGRYYFYVSAGGGQVGVMSAPSPKGPWTDPLGKPLLSGPFAKSLHPPTTFRDPCVFEDPDTQEHYIIAGVFVYYITKLKPDMISLAETPKLVNFTNHVYGPCGDGKTDDKPFLHKHGQTFYLSWGCFYATSTGSVYGPYTMQGAVIDTAKIAPDFQCDGQPHQCGKSTAPDAAAYEDLAPLRPSPGPPTAAAATAAPAPAAAGDPVVLYTCNGSAVAATAAGPAPAANTLWTTQHSGTNFSISPASNASLCITAPGRGGDGTKLVLQPCGIGVQHFVLESWAGKGNDVHGVGGNCPCWNVNDGNAHSPGNRHGRNYMALQCFSCVEGANFNPNQRFSLRTAVAGTVQVQAWSGYAEGYCVASVPQGDVPKPAPPPPKPWYLQEDYTDRHGSFLSHGGQWYHHPNHCGNRPPVDWEIPTCAGVEVSRCSCSWCRYYASNDRSHSQDRGHEGVFRDTVLCYIHYRANGTMEPCVIDKTGVGQYDAAQPIEAENFFRLQGPGEKLDLETAGDIATHHLSAAGPSRLGFAVGGLRGGSALHYNHVRGLPPQGPLALSLRLASSSSYAAAASYQVVARVSDGVGASSAGRVLGSVPVVDTGGWARYRSLRLPLTQAHTLTAEERADLNLVLTVEPLAGPAADDGAGAGGGSPPPPPPPPPSPSSVDEVVRLERFAFV